MTALTATPSVERESCSYTSCYCEENVYLLVKRLQSSELAELTSLYVVFISNREKRVPFWRQRSGSSGGQLVLWDYHVILVQRSISGSTLVWDLDSTLPWPCPFDLYAVEALGHGIFTLPAQFTRLYRVVRADVFLRHFASDRSHMQDGRGSYQQPPPAYPCIVAPDGATHTLPRYMEMPCLDEALTMQAAGESGVPGRRAAAGEKASRGQFGVVLTEAAFVDFFEEE